MMSVGNKLIVRLLEKCKTTEAGIILTPSTTRDKIDRGIVESAGPLCHEAIGHRIEEGDSVTFDSYSAVLIEESKKEGQGHLYVIPATAIYTVELTKEQLQERTASTSRTVEPRKNSSLGKKILKD